MLWSRVQNVAVDLVDPRKGTEILAVESLRLRDGKEYAEPEFRALGEHVAYAGHEFDERSLKPLHLRFTIHL